MLSAKFIFLSFEHHRKLRELLDWGKGKVKVELAVPPFLCPNHGTERKVKEA